MDFDQLTLTCAVADLRAGKVTSTALTTEALARAKANADLNAFVTSTRPALCLKAAAAFDANDSKDKPLGGVPIVIRTISRSRGSPAAQERRR